MSIILHPFVFDCFHLYVLYSRKSTSIITGERSLWSFQVQLSYRAYTSRTSLLETFEFYRYLLWQQHLMSFIFTSIAYSKSASVFLRYFMAISYTPTDCNHYMGSSIRRTRFLHTQRGPLRDSSSTLQPLSPRGLNQLVPQLTASAFNRLCQIMAAVLVHGLLLRRTPQQ